MDQQSKSLFNRDWPYIVLLTIAVLFVCSPVLFTDKIVRASDVITQLFWSVKPVSEQGLWHYLQSLPDVFQADWYPLSDGGRTAEGGWNSLKLLFYRFFVLIFLPFPASIAWLAALSLLWGGIGTYFYCRLVGSSRFSAFIGGLIFALCTENVSLINAGHIQKIETIVWLPWILLALEKALRSGRLYYYALTAFLLAIQFFTIHWQISFYTCLAVGAYWFSHVYYGFKEEKEAYRRRFGKDFLLAVVMVTLFFTTIAMSFAPLLNWSKQSERSGGMTTQEGMSWSMPPEEVLTFFIPGLVGYSRQEAGDVPKEGEAFYWGRMHFTQTNDYLGLLPWFLVPLALLFRKDRHTRFFTFLMAASLIMALGKYTIVYQLMFDYLPGFSTFRVPKMILFLFAFAVAVLASRGLDALLEEDRDRLKKWLAGCGVFTAVMGLFWIFSRSAPGVITSLASGFIDQPTRYQSGSGLIGERYDNLVREAAWAFATAVALFAAIVAGVKRWIPRQVFPVLLTVLLLADLWRVNDRFFVVTDPPQGKQQQSKNEIIKYLEANLGNYRMQPMNEENALYYSEEFGFPNISAYVTISEKRYKEFLDNFSLMSQMPDIVNLKYLVMTVPDFEAQKGMLTQKYAPVIFSNNVVLIENRTVLPKAWLVPSVVVMTEVNQRLASLANPNFNPLAVALVEAPSPIPLSPYNAAASTGKVELLKYEGNELEARTSSPQNSLLVIGDKYYKGWKAEIDGVKTEIYPVNHILRGIYVPAGTHNVKLVFDPLPFKIGKYLTLGSLILLAIIFGREFLSRRRHPVGKGVVEVNG